MNIRTRIKFERNIIELEAHKKLNELRQHKAVMDYLRSLNNLDCDGATEAWNRMTRLNNSNWELTNRINRYNSALGK